MRIQLTAEEEAQRDAEEAQALLDIQAEKDAKAAVLANKASAKAKLEALGLTADEIKDTFGIG
tara:strand:+ start:202 stop:390 length:189 start_codon:yes stop_codon:yes gene_type:complete